MVNLLLFLAACAAVKGLLFLLLCFRDFLAAYAAVKVRLWKAKKIKDFLAAYAAVKRGL